MIPGAGARIDSQSQHAGEIWSRTYNQDRKYHKDLKKLQITTFASQIPR